MARTDAISPESLAHAIALTRGMEAQIDHVFGHVLAVLESLGHRDDTIVLFTSDHGEFLGNHGLLHKGPPPYLDLNRVSFVMAGPYVPEGESTVAPSSHLDIMPTLLELCGVSDGGCRQDGESLLPVLEGQGLERRERFLEFHPRIAPRTYNHSVVTEAWRLTLYPQADGAWGELYDLKDDPGEHINLFNDPDHRTIRDSLTERLARSFPEVPEAGTELIAKW